MSTSAPPPRVPNAMAFFHDSDWFGPTGPARRFAGEDGRIATLPDIVQARLGAPAHDVSWERIVTTATAEYFGRSRGGVPVIAVAHDGGPLADPDGVFTAHVLSRDANGCATIPQDEFIALLDGAYGAVEIVELSSIYRLRRLPFCEMLTYEQACEDPLVRARLGPRTDEFLARHREVSRAWLRERLEPVRGNDCLISLQDTRRIGYGAVAMPEGRAYAHLIDVSPQTDYGHAHWTGTDWHRSLVTELSCHVWGERVGIVAVRGQGPIEAIHPGPEMLRATFARNWRRFVRMTDVADRERPRPLTKIDGLWFTRHDGTGVSREDGDPEHPVRAIRSCGWFAGFRMPLIGTDLTKVTLDEPRIAREAPPWANAWRIVSGARPVWERDRPTHHVISVEYVIADIDFERRLPPKRATDEEFDTLLSLPPAA
jgi:hypothetical protein